MRDSSFFVGLPAGAAREWLRVRCRLNKVARCARWASLAVTIQQMGARCAREARGRGEHARGGERRLALGVSDFVKCNCNGNDASQMIAARDDLYKKADFPPYTGASA